MCVHVHVHKQELHVVLILVCCKQVNTKFNVIIKLLIKLSTWILLVRALYMYCTCTP